MKRKSQEKNETYWANKIDANYTTANTGVTYNTGDVSKPSDYTQVKYSEVKTFGEKVEKEFENYAECNGCGRLVEKEDLNEDGYCDVQCKYNSCIIDDLEEESEE